MMRRRVGIRDISTVSDRDKDLVIWVRTREVVHFSLNLQLTALVVLIGMNTGRR